MPEKEKIKEENSKKQKGSFGKNLFVLLLFLITAGVVATYYYDIDHSDKIQVVVNKNLVQERQKDDEVQNRISIFVYDPSTKIINEREIVVPRQMNLIEGDFINGIIRNSNYITEDMKFRSAYNLRIDNVNTTVVKLNAQFANLKKNPELFNGFSQAVTNTILKNFPNIHSVLIQIDGEINTRLKLFKIFVTKDLKDTC